MRLQPAPRQDGIEHDGKLIPSRGRLRDLRLQLVGLRNSARPRSSSTCRWASFGAVTGSIKDQRVEVVLQLAHGVGDRTTARGQLHGGGG